MTVTNIDKALTMSDDEKEVSVSVSLTLLFFFNLCHCL